MKWLFLLLMGFALSFWAAFLTTFLWTWYITPIFKIASPSLIGLVGLSMTIKMFLFFPHSKKRVFGDVLLNFSTYGVAVTIAWVIAWALHFFA